jgi:excisionase family DNA binding protein
MCFFALVNAWLPWSSHSNKISHVHLTSHIQLFLSATTSGQPYYSLKDPQPLPPFLFQDLTTNGQGQPIGNQIGARQMGGEFVDVNGDGLVDFVMNMWTTVGTTTMQPYPNNGVYLNDGCSFRLSITLSNLTYCDFPTYGPKPSIVSSQSAVGDVDIFTVPDLASYLRTSVKEAIHLVEGGSIRAKKIGGEWRIHKKHVELFFDVE